MPESLKLSKEVLSNFCVKWRVQKLELFGSILTEKFSDQSDVDFLITFVDGIGPDLFDFVELKNELQQIVNRSVDVLDREVVENSDNRFRRNAILSMTRVIYDRAA